MGNEQGKKGKKGPAVHVPTPSEIKTFIMIAQNKLSLFRNKKIDAIRKKKHEIAKSLRENNLDVAKAKMDSLIREEDYITSYDILGPLLEILKERVTYIVTSTECPPDLRAQLDTVIYASTRLEFEELYRLRDLIMRKYGSAYISKAENNADKLVNVNLIEKLRIKPASDAFLTIRLKQLCKEQKIPFEFPSEIYSDIPGDIGNPFDQQGMNPYGGGGNNFNPYGPPGGNNNPYGPPGGNNNNPYGPPGGNNNNPYGPPKDNNNNNPYGPPGGNNNNPFGPPGDNDNNNPYGPPKGNNSNPYGPPGGNNNSQFGNNKSQLGQSNNQNDNNFGGDFNDYMNKQNNQNNGPNPFADYQNDFNKNDNSTNVNKSNVEDPFASKPNESIINNSNINKNDDNNNMGGESGNPYTSQNKPSENKSTVLDNPFDKINDDPFNKGTVISYNQNQPSNDNPYSTENDNSNPYGSPSSNNDNPFANNNADNPFSGGADSDFPKTDDNEKDSNNNNPYSDISQGGNPYEGDKSVSDQMFINPKVDSYNEVQNDHLPTLSSQIKSDKDKPDL